MQKPLLYYQEFRLNMSCHIVQNQENQLCQLTPNKLPRLQLESYEDAKEIKPFFESKIAYPIEELRLFKYKRSINILIFSTPLKFNINFSFTEQDLISFLRIFIHRGAFFNFKNTNSTVYLELPTFIENAKENFFDFLIYEVLLFQHKNSFSDLSDFDIIKELKKSTINEIKNIAFLISKNIANILHYFIEKETNAKAEAINQVLQRFIITNYGARNMKFFLFRVKIYFT